MKAAGIIAEYNPLHKGHEYHIRKSVECAEIDAILALISSNFTQRGEPAIVDKTARARMALACGADLVLELPCVFSCRNAGIFADAAVDILAAAGLVTRVSFGAESGEEKRELFDKAVDILNEEPKAFTVSLKKYLREGNSFVKARSAALEEMLPGVSELLKSPNNNLALAYIKRIRQKKYPLETLRVRRLGPGFNDLHTVEDGLASASAIREMIVRGDKETYRPLLPESSLNILKEEMNGGHVAAKKDMFWRAVRTALLRASPEELADVAEMSEGFENRMKAAAYDAVSMDDFVDRCSEKRYPRSRVQRYCAHILLNLRHDASQRFQKHGPAYIKVLGANAKGRRILKSIHDKSPIPVLSRAGGRVSPYAREILRFERTATEIWEMLTDNPRNDAERRAVPVMCP
ncbi:MAG: nucleotidyltransferase family protein [Synergistaceae bacterium]|jgi:predicted nucleotidyltransferase|nr:nucleotidyltransferase family protein [Synergistaceae bacterium]